MKLLITPESFVTEHFQVKELMCPCCGKILLSDIFCQHMRIMELIRVEAGFPITINSGCRCEKHNRSVGGALRTAKRLGSWHLIFATDFRPSDGDPEKLGILMAIAPKYFTGIGKYWSFIHGDLRPHPYTWDNRTARAVKR